MNMANPLERERADTVAAEVLLTELLREVADRTSSPSVRKTTLSALLAAIDEEGGGPAEYDVPLNRLAGSGLGDALLQLRHRGLVRLTDDGFTVSEHGADPAVGSDSGLSKFLESLVSKKLREWHVAPAGP